MYIVRWLMGHPMIAVWFLGAIAILLSYGSGHKEADTTGHEKSAHESSEISTAVEPAHKAEVTNSDFVVVEPNQEDSIENIDKVDEMAQPQEDKSTDSTEKHNIDAQETVVTVSDAESTVKKIVLDQKTQEKPQSSIATALPVKDKSTSLDNNQPEVADLSQYSSEEMLKMAREAYWNNGLDEAAQIYQKLIKIEPKVVAHRGELGNVYWRQGYPKKAAELYSEVAIPMIESGNSERVANMVGFINLFYPDRATVIQDRLERLNKQNK